MVSKMFLSFVAHFLSCLVKGASFLNVVSQLPGAHKREGAECNENPVPATYGNQAPLVTPHCDI